MANEPKQDRTMRDYREQMPLRKQASYVRNNTLYIDDGSEVPHGPKTQALIEKAVARKFSVSEEVLGHIQNEQAQLFIEIQELEDALAGVMNRYDLDDEEKAEQSPYVSEESSLLQALRGIDKSVTVAINRITAIKARLDV